MADAVSLPEEGNMFALAKIQAETGSGRNKSGNAMP